MTRTLTAKGAATRARIVEGAAELFRAGNIVTTTLDDVMLRTGTSKSQLFHYFPEGKEQLLLAVGELEADRAMEDNGECLAHLTSWKAWDEWRATVVDRYRDQENGCALSALYLQVGHGSPAARAILRTLLSRWGDQLAAGMRSMQAAGELSPSFDVDRAATALLSAMQGGVTILMATGDSSHLEAALDEGIERMRAA
ncbi:TetR/AcrR family transcriptional regulator [Umezawaea endophytica]|uniref:TetR/AcrR family transcriptional regulator n=1 Tax=Umezawaea endophytica TaxID=1654476 RepID=A0A9X3A0J0_9PSEU|nr:TetR/AcrR family transcriptional regulator [Umezawaea endophytica]MCS7478619.1 TetR/AcrR family transcriptional regulator [Umezawaea endophytica]